MFPHMLRAISMLTLILCLGATGCHTVPLGNPETSVSDPNLAGWWEADKPGMLFHVFVYDKHTYVINAYTYKEEATLKPDGRLTAKAWMTAVKGMDVMTLQIISPELELEGPEEAAACYSYYRIRKMNGGIEAMQLTDKFYKDTKTPDELAKKIGDTAANEESWKGIEPLILKHITLDKLEHVKQILKAFAPAKTD